MKILVSDKLAQEGVDILEKSGAFQVDCEYGLTPEQLKIKIKDYDALIVRSGTTVTAEIIEAADNLKVIGRAGVGLDNVDLKAATKKGIVAMNTPAGNTTSTAEHTFSLILALSRNIAPACAAMKAGRWDRSKFSGVEVHGKTLGVIGMGRIGATVAKFAKAFAMNVIAYDPYLSKEIAQQKGIELVDLEIIYKTSDYITVHIPKTNETKNLISDKQIAMMKPTVRLINCARGGIFNEKAVAKALEEKRIAGCAFDVFDDEPYPADGLLTKFDNCLTTPHLGASTSEAQINVAVEVAESVSNALLGRGIMNAANFPSVDAESYKILEPYINLGMRMGKFAGQLIKGSITEVNLSYSGIFKQYKAAPVSLSFVNGLLKPILGDSINYINAADVASERGINVQEIKSNKDDEFVNCIKAEIKTDKETFRIVGALSSHNDPRIVKINDVYVDAAPDGHVLVITNNDKPGLVGAVGTILAKHNINIAGISLGREAQDGMAVSVVNIDTEASDEVIEQLRATKDVTFIKALKV